MDNIEKQQTIEALKVVINTRWLYVLTVAFQGFIVKLMFPGIPLPSGKFIFFVVVLVLCSNFIFWIYIKRPLEKIKDCLLRIFKNSIIIFDQIALFVIFYFSGTANKMLFIIYFLTVLLASVIYRVRGVVFFTFFAAILYSVLVFLEYFGLLVPLSQEAIKQSSFRYLKGEIDLIKGHLIGYNLYLATTAIIAGFIANFFKKREKELKEKTEEAIKKSEQLSLQTKELLKTQQELQLALQKSEISKKAALRAREEMEKANLELKKKIEELEKFYKITVGREVKMVELKERIKELEEKLKEK